MSDASMPHCPTCGQPVYACTCNDEDITRNYHGGDPFSTEAFETTSPAFRARMRAICYDLISKAGMRGLTSDEAEAILRMRHQQVSPRFTDLKKDRLIKVIGRRKTRLGRPAGVCVIIPRQLELELADGTKCVRGLRGIKQARA